VKYVLNYYLLVRDILKTCSKQVCLKVCLNGGTHQLTLCVLSCHHGMIEKSESCFVTSQEWNNESFLGFVPPNDWNRSKYEDMIVSRRASSLVIPFGPMAWLLGWLMMSDRNSCIID
jgi:hypothetical protein